MIAARDHAFRILGLATLVSYVAVGNIRSQAVAERLGARAEPDAPYPGLEPSVVYRHPPAKVLQ